jgi:hypothetical protein
MGLGNRGDGGVDGCIPVTDTGRTKRLISIGPIDRLGYETEREPMFRRVGLVLATAAFVLTQGRSDIQGQPTQTKLWAAITVQEPIFQEGRTESLVIYFGLVNDGTSTINPKIDSSHLFINGVEPKDWPFIITNGLRTPSFDSLPPGQYLRFTYVLGRYFQKPGVYTLRWKGENFRSADLTFRVLPGKR